MLNLILIVLTVTTIINVCYSCLPSASDILTVKERHEPDLLAVPGVVGVGIGNCNKKPCIKVFVDIRTPELERRIPKQLDGFEVSVEVTGSIQLLT